MDWFINRYRGQSIWIDISVVRFLPLSFYAKKKVAERKARIRGGGAKDTRIREYMAAHVVRIAMQFLRMSFAHAPLIMYLPYELLSRLRQYRFIPETVGKR